MAILSDINSAISIGKFIKQHWKEVLTFLFGGGSSMGLAIFEKLPLTAIYLAAIFGAIGFLTLKQKFFPTKKVAEGEITTQDIAKALVDGLAPSKDFAIKLTNKDVEKMACGYFNSTKQIFEYRQKPGKLINTFKQKAPELAGNFIKLDIEFLPSIAKKVLIYFEAFPKEIRDNIGYKEIYFKPADHSFFYIKNGNDEIKVNHYSKSIEADLHDSYSSKFIEFRFEWDQNAIGHSADFELRIYAKSFTI